MEFTKKEQELMEVLWKAGRPLSSKEIVENSIDKTWKDSSIHILLNSLLDKGAIKEAGYVRTGKGYEMCIRDSPQSYFELKAENY